MTSSASTGTCPTSISPPSRRSDPERTLEAHVVALDPQPFEGLGQRIGVVESPAVVVPAVGCPDLRVIARPDDHGLLGRGRPSRAGRPASRTRPCRSSSASTAPENTKRWKQAGVGIGDRHAATSPRGHPAGLGVDRQAAVHPARDNRAGLSCARNRAGTAIRPLSSTVCRYSPVNTVGSPLRVVRPGRLRRSPSRGSFPTSHHFAPLRHSSAQTGAVKAKSHTGSAGWCAEQDRRVDGSAGSSGPGRGRASAPAG